MAKPVLLQTISILSKKVDELLEAQNSMLDKVRTLELENQELRLQHEKDTEMLDAAKKDIEFLSLSHRLADSPEAIISARNKISKLIRTIDSCIRIIKED